MKRAQSPCIDICKFSAKNSWCLGCGRTLQECKEWKRMKPYAKIRLIKDLNRRMINKGNESSENRIDK